MDNQIRQWAKMVLEQLEDCDELRVVKEVSDVDVDWNDDELEAADAKEIEQEQLSFLELDDLNKDELAGVCVSLMYYL